MRGLVTEDAVIDDRRPGLVHTIDGREAIVDELRAIADVGGGSVDLHTVAIRGELSCLVSADALTGETGFDALILVVFGSTPDGLLCRQVRFDADDWDAAFDELDAAWADGEGAGLGDLLRATLRPVRARNARDWDGVRDALTDNYLMVDHRPASGGELDRQAFIGSTT